MLRLSPLPKVRCLPQPLPVQGHLPGMADAVSINDVEQKHAEIGQLERETQTVTLFSLENRERNPREEHTEIGQLRAMSGNGETFFPSDRTIKVDSCKVEQISADQIFVTVLIPPTSFRSANVINRTARIKIEKMGQNEDREETKKNSNSDDVEYSIRAEYVDPECPWQKLTKKLDPCKTNFKKFDPGRFDAFVKEWLEVLNEENIEDMLKEKSNLTLVISPKEDGYDSFKPLEQDSSQDIHFLRQPRVLAVDWEKNGLVTAIDSRKGRELLVMRNVNPRCTGDDIMEQIKKGSTGLPEPTTGISKSKGMITDWHDDLVNTVDWFETDDGDWAWGATQILKKACRSIPSAPQLKGESIDSSQFDSLSGDKRIFPSGKTRSTYFVSMDDFEMLRFDVKEKGADISKIKEQMKGITLAQLKARSFSDRQCAEEFAKDHLPGFYKNEVLEPEEMPQGDTFFELKTVDDASCVSRIQDALVVIFRRAQAESAVLIFSDLFSDRASTKVVERALAFAGFDGPVLNFSICMSVVHPETGGRLYSSRSSTGSGKTMRKQGLLSPAVTHSFEVDSEEANGHTRAAVAFAAAIAGVANADEEREEVEKQRQKLRKAKQWNRNKIKQESDQSKTNDKEPRVSDAICILVNGSLPNLEHISAAARRKMALLILQGSGKLSDSLPNIYLSRNDFKFDAFGHCDKLIESCGLLSGDSIEVCALLTGVLQSNRIIIHKLENGIEALKRSWAFVTVLKEDLAMTNAKDRRNLYKAVASRNYMPTHIMNIICLVVSFAITVIATVQGYMNSQDGSDGLDSQFRSDGLNSTLPVSNSTLEGSSSGSDPVLHYLIVVLPVLLSVLTSLRQDLNHSIKFLAFSFGAAVIDSELYRYKTKTGVYSDSAAKGDTRLAMDAAAGCSEMLSKSLVTVSASLNKMGIIAPDPGEVKQSPAASGWISSLCGGCFCKADDKSGQLDEEKSKLEEEEMIGIDKYVKLRLKERARELHERETVLTIWVNTFKSYLYILGAVSSILGLLGLAVWVPIVIAAVSAVNAWNETFPLHEQLKMVADAAEALDDIITQWEALPQEKKRLQVHQDTLVDQAEKAILSSFKRPNGYVTDGVSTNMHFSDPTESSSPNAMNKGPPPGVVTPSIQKRIIELLESGSSADQIILDSIVAEMHLTNKEVGCIIDEYEATKRKKETEILTMYFEEGLTLDMIRDTLKDSEESIKTVILDARQKALKKLVEKNMNLGSTPKSIEEFIKDFIKNKPSEFKQTGLTEKALKFLVNNIYQLVHGEREDQHKTETPGKSDVFPEFRLKKLDDALSCPNHLTGRELKKLSDFIKNQFSEIKGGDAPTNDSKEEGNDSEANGNDDSNKR